MSRALGSRRRWWTDAGVCQPRPGARREPDRQPASTASSSSQPRWRTCSRTEYLRVRVHDASQSRADHGRTPSGDTVGGAFIRSVEGRIADLEATVSPTPTPRRRVSGGCSGLAAACWQARRSGHEDLERLPAQRRPLQPVDHRARPRAHHRQGSERGREVDAPAGDRGRPHRRCRCPRSALLGRGGRLPGHRRARVRMGGRGARGPHGHHYRASSAAPHRLVLDGGLVDGEARIAGEPRGISGIPSASFLRSTASVRHHELDDLATDDAAFGERLRGSISGSDRDSRSARRRLAAALAGLQANGTSPGRLKVAETAVADAAARLAHAEDGLVRLARDREVHLAARERRAEAETSLADRRTMLEKARRAEELITQRDASQERYERYKEAVVLRDEVSDLDGRHPSVTPLPVLRTGVERLRTLDGRIAALEEELAGEVHVEFDVEPEVVWRPMSRLSLVLVVIGVAIAIAGFVLEQIGVTGSWPIVPVIGALVAGAGVVVAAVGLYRRRKNRHGSPAARRRDRPAPARSLRHGGRAQALPGGPRDAPRRARLPGLRHRGGGSRGRGGPRGRDREAPRPSARAHRR